MGRLRGATNRGVRVSDRATRRDWLVMLRPLGEDPRSLVYAAPRLCDAVQTHGRLWVAGPDGDRRAPYVSLL